VAASDGEVTLTGDVASYSEKTATVEATERVYGITSGRPVRSGPEILAADREQHALGGFGICLVIGHEQPLTRSRRYYA
jgi:hypothetical protein